MEVISHPFRVSSNGTVATVLEGSTDANAEAIAVLSLTRLGERVLVPDFGTSDPAFVGVNAAEIANGLALFGPDGVTITDVSVTWRDAAHATYLIEFDDQEPQ